MSSYPYFDATNLEEDWPVLIDDPNAPLLNRAAQGLYPAGPAQLPFIAAFKIELILDNPDPEELLNLSPHTQTCAFHLSGESSWNPFLTNGCQETLDGLLGLTDPHAYATILEKLGFYSAPMMYLEVAQPPSFPDTLEKISGLKNIQLSPLQAAIAASTLTNQGIRPVPRPV